MYNIDTYEKQYGELFVKQLEIEEGYKKLAKEAARKVYEGAEDSTQQRAGAAHGFRIADARGKSGSPPPAPRLDWPAGSAPAAAPVHPSPAPV